MRLCTTALFLKWYRTDPVPGIHAAIEWLLRHKKEGPDDRPLDWEGAAALAKIDSELKKRTIEWTSSERQRADEPTWRINGQGQTMILLSGPVEFRMCSPRTDPDAVGDNERPRIRHTPRSFAIASKPVTVEQWERFLKDHPEARFNYAKRHRPESNGPIIAMTWYEAAHYCNWPSEQEGLPESEWCFPKHADNKEGMKTYPDYLRRKGYRLPTEAEWKCAASAGTATRRYLGDSLELLPRYAWFIQNSQDRTWPVGQKRPNELGLFDAQGNVWTWCGDPALLFPQMVRGRAITDKEDIIDVTDRIRSFLRGGSFAFQAK